MGASTDRMAGTIHCPHNGGMSSPWGRRRFRAGQAAVETALTMPLTVFLILGTLQLFLMLQGRILAQYAVFKATRAGSVSQGECRRMMDAAVASLAPAFMRTDDATNLANAYSAIQSNGWKYTLRGFTQDVVWIIREQPTGVTAPEEYNFDQGGPLSRLEVKMVFWYPMRIPFANWVITKMARTFFIGIDASYGSADPLNPANTNVTWSPEATMDAQIRNTYKRWSARENIFPIVTSYSMRMMTPAKASFFSPQNCPPAP